MTSNELDQPTIYFPTFREIYEKSIFNDFELLYDNYTLLSVKTANSMSDIEKMPYWKYNSLLKSLQKYIEKENKQSGDENGEQPDVSAESKKMMQNAKSSIPKFQKPKLK
jgi:hypothetical protein